MKLDEPVLCRMHERLTAFRTSPFFCRWNEVRVGTLGLGDLYWYFFADCFYRDAWIELAGQAPARVSPRSWRQRLYSLMRNGQWSLRVLRDSTESIAPAAVKTGEALRAVIRTLPPRQHATDGVWTAGFMNLSGPYFHTALEELAAAHVPVTNVRLSAPAWRRAVRVEKAAREIHRRFPPNRSAISFAPSLPHLFGRLRRDAHAIFSVEEALETGSPRLLLIPDERLPAARGIAAMTRAKDVRCLSVVHTVEGSLIRPPLLEEAQSHTVAVSDPRIADFLARGGKGRDTFVAARMDPSPHEFEVEPESVVYICQALSGELEIIRNLAARLGGTKFTVRPHPRQKRGWLQWQLPNIEILAPMPLDEAIARAKVLVMHSSTTAWWAYRTGRSVVILNPSGGPQLTPLLDAPGFRWVKDFDGAAREIKNLLAAPPPAPVPYAVRNTLTQVILDSL